MFKKVLFPLSFDIDVVQIINTSRFLYELNIEQFHLLHVISGGLGESSTARNLLEKAAAYIRENTGFSVSADLAEGHAATQIVTLAKERMFDLIFIPAHNKNIMTRTLLGSTSSDVIRMTETPALIYKCFFQEPLSWSTVLYATDFEEAAERAIPYVQFLGQVASKLIIQHVGRRAADPQTESKRQQMVGEKLVGLKKELTPFWREISTVTEIGNPPAAICDTSRSFRADLVVLGRGNAGFLKKLLGSTAERVANTVDSSILLVP